LVTFRNRKTYDLEGLKENAFDFMNSLMLMVGANEYIERMRAHSNRTWQIKREEAQTTGKIMSANVPHWIDTIVDERSSTGRPIKQHFELNSDKSAIVGQIVNLFLSGQGCQTIARQLNLENVPCIGRTKRKGKYWGQTNVRAILNNEALCGRYVHRKRAEKALPTSEIITIEGYYPQLVTPSTYGEIKLLLKSANRSKSRRLNAHPTPANPLQGLCRCSECGSLMTRVSQRAYRGRKAYEKLVCIAGKQGKHKYRSIPVDDVIGHLFMLLRFPVSFSGNEHDALTPLMAKRANCEAKIGRVTEAISNVGLSAALQRSLAGLEADLAMIDKAIAEEASKAVYGDAQRIAKLSAETLEALQTSMDAAGINSLLRRLFKSLKIDIEAAEVWAEWHNGKVSVLTV
jgi:hypothetical protein